MKPRERARARAGQVSDADSAREPALRLLGFFPFLFGIVYHPKACIMPTQNRLLKERRSRDNHPLRAVIIWIAHVARHRAIIRGGIKVFNTFCRSRAVLYPGGRYFGKCGEPPARVEPGGGGSGLKVYHKVILRLAAVRLGRQANLRGMTYTFVRDCPWVQQDACLDTSRCTFNLSAPCGSRQIGCPVEKKRRCKNLWRRRRERKRRIPDYLNDRQHGA